MKKYLRLIWIELKKGKEYSLNFIGTLVYLPIQLIIIYFIWKFVFHNTASIANYTFVDMVTYYILLRIFESAISPVGVTAYEVWNDINQGNLNLFLSRPIFYPFYLFFTKIGYFIWGLVSGFLFLFCARFFLVLEVQFQLSQILLGIQSAFFGLIIMYTLFFLVGSLTFWVENVLTLRDNLWNVIQILSGQIFPIVLFPGVIRRVAEVLPFQQIYFIPISFLQGKFIGTVAVRVLFAQSLWAVGMTLAAVVVWNVGSRRYTAQGG